MSQTNLSIIRKNTVPLTVTVLSGAVALNITGYTFYFTAKKDYASVASISKTVTTLSDPTHGIMEITLLPEDTDVDPGEYFYDVQMVSGAGAVTTLFYGKLTVVANMKD